MLEVGGGTGYNSALIAHIVGENGSVATVDIDANLVLGERAMAALVRHDDEPTHADGAFDLDVRGFGPNCDTVAHELAGHVRAWVQRGRPSTAQLRIRAYPLGKAFADTPGSIVIDKPRTRLVLD